MIFRSVASATLLMVSGVVRGQGCCSGGSGSPIAGGAAQGVLSENQLELSLNGQYTSTSRFYTADRETPSLFDRLSSSYLYGRIAYGLSDRFTMSVESGYYIHRTQYGHRRLDTITSGGIADVIVFPRYSVFIKNTERTRTELTLGLGLKIPVGKFNDSTVVYRNLSTGAQYYAISPPTIQPTNGSQDFIFYGFVYRGYTEKKFRVFANTLYLRRGWNQLGQKFGDLVAVGLFAGQNLGKKISVTLQVRGEWAGSMKYDPNVDMLALYNIDVHSTGSRKLFVSPQVSCAAGGWIFYALYEWPCYQYLIGTQVGSQHAVTAGVSYRFFVKR